MGSRSRKRRRAPGPPPAPRPRGAERDERIRDELEPLGQGERPGAVTVAACVALLFAVGNVVAAVLGGDLSSDQGDPVVFTAITTTLLVVAAAGMFAAKYWAVLGFQMILALQILVFALLLSRVEKWWAAVGLTVAIGLLGWLFWRLIQAMARLQMPERRPSQSSR